MDKKINIITDFKNNLLKRREISLSIEADSNPGFAKMQQECLNYFKLDEDRAVIKRIQSKFGKSEFFVEVFIYESINDKDKIESKQKQKNKKASEGKK